MLNKCQIYWSQCFGTKPPSPAPFGYTIGVLFYGSGEKLSEKCQCLLSVKNGCFSWDKRSKDKKRRWDQWLDFNINSLSMKIADKLFIIAEVAGGDIRIILQKPLQRTEEDCDKWSLRWAECGDRWWSWFVIGEGEWWGRRLAQPDNIGQQSLDLGYRNGEGTRSRKQSFSPKGVQDLKGWFGSSSGEMPDDHWLRSGPLPQGRSSSMYKHPWSSGGGGRKGPCTWVARRVHSILVLDKGSNIIARSCSCSSETEISVCFPERPSGAKPGTKFTDQWYGVGLGQKIKTERHQWGSMDLSRQSWCQVLCTPGIRSLKSPTPPPIVIRLAFGVR